MKTKRPGRSGIELKSFSYFAFVSLVLHERRNTIATQNCHHSKTFLSPRLMSIAAEIHANVPLFSKQTSAIWLKLSSQKHTERHVHAHVHMNKQTNTRMIVWNRIYIYVQWNDDRVLSLRQTSCLCHVDRTRSRTKPKAHLSIGFSVHHRSRLSRRRKKGGRGEGGKCWSSTRTYSHCSLSVFIAAWS